MSDEGTVATGEVAVDWAAVEEEAIAHLQELLRIDTTNPPGNEIHAVRWLEAILQEAGLESVMVETAPGRGNLVCRLPGSGSTARSEALILTSHVDVVAAEPEHWTHPPFSGTRADGCIWGRGALDMKSMTIYGLTALLLARRHTLPLKRDLVLVAAADEETGSGLGWQRLATDHRELVAGRWALNELGGFSTEVQPGRRLYPIQVAEKGVAWVRVKASGSPGHGSMPRDDNAVVRLARAIAGLQDGVLEHRVHPAVRTFLQAMAEEMGFPQGVVLRQLLRGPGWFRRLSGLLPAGDRRNQLRAMLHDTVNPTGLKAGVKENVIPSVAEATLDCRFLPGKTPEQIVGELARRLGPDFQVELITGGHPAEAPTDTELYDIIGRVIEARDPGARVAPYLMVGFTDGPQLARAGITTYGFQPMRLPGDFPFSSLIHGHDERIPEDSFRWGLRTFFEVVLRFCC